MLPNCLGKLIKSKFGDKIALLGTIDDSNLLKFSTPSEIKKSVTKSIKELGPGGYVPGATNTLLDQPVENVIAMYDAIREYKLLKDEALSKTKKIKIE